MTCIIGFKQLGKTVIAGDSCGSDGVNVQIRADAKVFRVGDFILGCTTSFRMIQLLRFSLVPPKYYDQEDIYKYMCTQFVDAVRNCFRSGGFLEVEKNVESGGTFLVAYKDRLFHIMGDYQVAELLDPYTACGCGKDYALGAMAAMAPDIDPTKVLDIVTHFSAGVRPPYVIETT